MAPLVETWYVKFCVKLVVCSVAVCCRHAGFPALTGTATVTAVVIDSNDNTPRFNHDSYDARVTENRRPGDVVAQVSATDRDTGRNADIRSVRHL